MANGTTAEEVGCGEVAMMFVDKTSRTRKFLAKDVQYVLDIEANVLSVSQMERRCLAVTFLESEAIISRKEEVVAVAYLEDDLY